MFNLWNIFRKRKKEQAPVIICEEKGIVKLVINATEQNKALVRENLKILRGFDMEILADDVVDVTYNFNLLYFENIEKRLAALTGLIFDERTKAKITDMSVNELSYGESIFLEIARKIDTLLAAREGGRDAG